MRGIINIIIDSLPNHCIEIPFSLFCLLSELISLLIAVPQSILSSISSRDAIAGSSSIHFPPSSEWKRLSTAIGTAAREFSEETAGLYFTPDRNVLEQEVQTLVDTCKGTQTVGFDVLSRYISIYTSKERIRRT